MILKQRDKQILSIALPAIVTNITVPLLGLIDTAIVGHLGDASYIGAIAVGAMIFNLIYWMFGFLRMGTSGMTAQAHGRRDMTEICSLLRNSLLQSFSIALLLLLLQWPLCELMLWLLGPTPDVSPLTATYFYIVVWGAPASLGLFSLTGWFIGMQNTVIPMQVSILQNISNIIMSLFFVYVLGMKIEGVALGTVIAQYTGLLVAIVLLWRNYRRLWKKSRQQTTYNSHHASLTTFFRVNRDIFLRTCCLVAVNLAFTALGARQGATILAVNALLMQLYLLFSYVLDGFAYAGEALGGRYWGAQDGAAFRDVVNRLFRWGALMTVFFTAVYLFGGTPFLRLLTDESGVIEASSDYIWWAYLIPIAGVAAFIWDGIFIGTTQTRGMLLSACIAACTFFGIVVGLTGLMGNHALWLAQVLFLTVRGAVQTIIYATQLQKTAS